MTRKVLSIAVGLVLMSAASALASIPEEKDVQAPRSDQAVQAQRTDREDVQAPRGTQTRGQASENAAVSEAS